jgi:hypothetical protein
VVPNYALVLTKLDKVKIGRLLEPGVRYSFLFLVARSRVFSMFTKMANGEGVPHPVNNGSKPFPHTFANDRRKLLAISCVVKMEMWSCQEYESL